MNDLIQVLDHGYVRLVETWGQGDSEVPEAGIVEAARQSTQKNFRGWGPFACASCVDNGDPVERCEDKKDGDEKLLRYMASHAHMTPFEFAGMVVEVQAPIFVFREWHRHRTQSYNEMSARYAPLPNLNYVPTVERIMLNQGTKNKQGQGVVGALALTEDGAEGFRIGLQAGYQMAEAGYQSALEAGVPKELARLGLPVGRYSRMRASANLRNWLAFATLRSDQNPDAQWEIRQYGNAIVELVRKHFPQTLRAFEAQEEKERR